MRIRNVSDDAVAVKHLPTDSRPTAIRITSLSHGNESAVVRLLSSKLEGNDYLKKDFPNVDYIKAASIVAPAPAAK